MQFFLFFEAKEAVEVIEASEIFRTTANLEINQLVARITSFFFI
jgi:hypothetical protein